MCVFCNQRSISGKKQFFSESVREEIDTVSGSVDVENCEVELAFFGGSFTGIDRALMIELLSIGDEYKNKGIVSSLRCSTRPDYIDGEILDILHKYGMDTVELGIQSVSDKVLEVCRRGHTFESTDRACRMIRERGFDLVGQMMIGLPGSSAEDEIATAEYICSVGAVGARVYPTVVFYDTELMQMCRDGSYTPLTTEEAVMRTKRVLDIFDKNSVPCIRVGLCSSENLSDENCVFGGANDAAIGEMAMSALYLEKIEEKLAGTDVFGKDIVIYCPRSDVSKVSGHRRSNKEYILKKYHPKSVKIIEKDELIGYNIRIGIS